MSHAGHNMGDMSMGDMSAGPGIPPLIKFPQYYYAVVGAAVGVATLVNVYNKLLYRQRIAAAGRGDALAAKPKNWLSQTLATAFAITREASNATLSLPFLEKIPFLPRSLRTPTVGSTAIVLANVTTLIVMAFYGLDTTNRRSFEDIAYRTGFVSIMQMPLIFLLAGKNNIIGMLTGVSHERLNWLHRWCARCLLLTTTIHFGYWLGDWWPYGSFASRKIRTDPITRRGVIAWAILVWIVLSSMTPIRGLSYELFVLQHLVSFAVFIGFVYIHSPAEVHPYIWIPVGLFFFDRVVRACYVLYTNISYFHPRQRKEGNMEGLWACRATFTPLSHGTTRITIQNPPISWAPGQHVFLSCHSIVPLQSHPFTIGSIPADGRMDFYVKAEKGGTKRFFRHAEKSASSLPSSASAEGEVQVSLGQKKAVAIEGPYGCIRPLRQFDSVVLFAGSTGATFTVPLMRDIVAGWRQKNPVVTRHIRFVWVVKSRGQLSWFSPQLSAVVEDLAILRAEGHSVKAELSIYVTCDESFTEDHKTLLKNQGLTTHGKVEEYLSSAVSDFVDEKKGSQGRAKEKILEIASRELSGGDFATTDACGPDGECYCKGTVEDEDAITGQAATCCCGHPLSNITAKPSVAGLQLRTTASSSASSRSSKTQFLLHPGVSLFTGRPQCTNIIRRSLEQALGESAVVVCGPKGLVNDVRSASVALSDERAVHKGTGAQGIYLHTESFGY